MATLKFAEDVTTKSYKYGHKFVIDIVKIEAEGRWESYIWHRDCRIKQNLLCGFTDTMNEYDFIVRSFALADEASKDYKINLMEV